MEASKEGSSRAEEARAENWGVRETERRETEWGEWEGRWEREKRRG